VVVVNFLDKTNASVPFKVNDNDDDDDEERNMKMAYLSQAVFSNSLVSLNNWLSYLTCKTAVMLFRVH